jgi:hypothetical protein
MLYYLYRNFEILIKIKNVLKIIAAGIILYLISRLFPQGEIIFLFWSLILFAFYLFLLFIFGEIKKEDLAIFKNLVFRKKKEEVKEEFSGTEPGA